MLAAWPTVCNEAFGHTHHLVYFGIDHACLQAEKALERIKEEGLIPKPFVAKKRSFTFPPVEKMGQKV